MARYLFLSPSQEDDLRTFLGTPEEAYKAILNNGGWESAMTLPHLIKSVSLPPADAEIVVRLLIGLRLLAIQSGDSAINIIENIASGVANDKWEAKDTELWNRRSELLLSLLDQPGLRRVAMIVNLSYEYSNILQSSRIISDIRPIYDEAAEAIEAAVITYTLRLRYDSADGEHSLSVAMDECDIISLQMQCERALEKAKTAEMTMRGTRPILATIAGNYEDSDEPSKEDK